jgi:hypothetical protein
MSIRIRARRARANDWRDDTGCDAWLQAHAVKRIAKAMLSGETDIVAIRYESTAFARLFFNDALGARMKMPKSNGCRRPLSRYCDKGTSEDDD